MVGEEDSGGSLGHCEVSSNHQRKFWRSASWSSSQTANRNLDNGGKDSVDSSGRLGDSAVQSRRVRAPLTPRSGSCKGRLCLPPLQPLAITRRSLDEWPKAGSDDIGEWPGPLTPGARDMSKGGERLKLDIAAIQRNSDEGGCLVKKDKIASFDKQCSKVAEHIFLGGDAVARDRGILKKNGITHVLNCAGFVCPEYFKSEFVYRTLWLQDSPTEDITSVLYDVFDYFEDVRDKKGRVFVHCFQGVSRSASLAIAYIMWREGRSFDDALQRVKEARGIADPNMGFSCQLLQCQKRVHAFPLSPNSALRMYRIAPHSPYDPLHLVPKMLNDPSASCLDSRGSFIVQVPSAIYVWVGKNCEVIMEREARDSVSQIVRYERVNSPVHVIKEGEEPPVFWDIFANFVMEKSANGISSGHPQAKFQPGERKVDLYDVDFDILQKAIEGGFVPPVSPSETELETHLPARENSWSVLRRKFASCHRKEFVSAPKMVVNRLFTDSRLNSSHTSDNLSTSSSPSSVSSSSSYLLSSTSPSYLSPDSISSDSTNNSKCSSESPIESPSSTLTSFSNLSLHSSKTLGSVSNHSNYIEVDLTSQPLKSVPPPSRRSPVSIAERRGSLSKFLKLPILSNDGRMQDSSQKYSVDDQDDINLNDIACISFDLEKGGKILDHKEVNCGDSDHYKRVTEVDSWKEEHDKTGVTENPNVLPTLSDNCISQKPSIYSFPNLEKISLSGAGDLDSFSALVFSSSRAAVGFAEEAKIYLWVGRSFTWKQVCLSRKFEDVKLSDLNQMGSYVLFLMDLPEATDIKIIKEGEETADFLELLNTL